MVAAFHGHTPAVQLLVKRGAKVNLPDKSGESALVKASARGHTATAKELLLKGAG